MEADEEQFETHFVENPFIKLREKTLTKNLESKAHIGSSNLKAKDEDHDIMIIKETGKFVIKDLEEEA
jgi:hypothetical protein